MEQRSSSGKSSATASTEAAEQLAVGGDGKGTSNGSDDDHRPIYCDQLSNVPKAVSVPAKDIIFLPLGSLMVLLNNRGRIAPSSFVKVYESVRNLGSIYFATSNTKHSLLKPNLPFSNVHHTPLLQELTYTKPASCCSYYANTPKKDVDGHVKGLVTCMVMDDLSLKPLSSISRITVLNTRKVKDVSRLEEKIVNVDIEKLICTCIAH
ncbi:hypothetical protein RJ640_015455 [Escallonia rubra]|uniref:Uncharacterized protein n=1 Tax=Escallonia rubra TaxID=112253 RepID=A0AA88UC57_9ASTE|nr:hypothetical protein RJ640_015455 [Escallonia rubra]